MRAQALLFAASLVLVGCSNDVTPSGTAEHTGPRASIQPNMAVLEEDSPGLLARATVSDAAARAVALERFPGSQIVDAELDEDDGRLMYKYELRVGSERRSVDVNIDANTGSIVKVEDDDVDDVSYRKPDARLDTKSAPNPAPRSLRPARQRPRVFIASRR